ncbi:MAG: copper resistance protein CopC [Micropruina sp.]|nr:copper resistance protein CopC [Micropruina sp.]
MRFRRLVAVLTIGLMVMVGAAPAAQADDYLDASDPQPRQELQDAPGWVTLSFRSKASANLAKVLVLDAGGKNVTSGALIVEGTNVTSQLDDNLPRGTYSVYYRTSGSDGKPRGGAFQFAYGPGQWTPLDKEVWVGEAEEPPILKNPDPNETGPGEPSETPTATPTSAPPETPSATPSPEPTVTAEPSESPAATPDEGGDSPAGWLVGAGVAAAVLAGWAVVLLVRRIRTGG